jgi:parvulin-like peptidyl-prolyl isomerase
LGVAIFRYVGAEAPPKSERKKEDALRLAQAAAERGQSDFAGAVAAGDRGSDENIGWIDRGILEPAVEHAIFSLDVEKVAAEPIDSPRGYLVVRRIR